MKHSGAWGRATRRPLVRRSATVLAVVALLVGVVPGLGGPGGRLWAAVESVDQPSAAAQLQSYEQRSRGWNDRRESAPADMVWRSVRVGGVVRRYLLSLPPHRAGAPLVLAFHGLGERASVFAEQTGLVAATRAAGEVLAVPESDGPVFNDGRLGRAGPPDDAFALAVIRHLVARHLVDPSRVTVAGFSNGAGMAMQVAGAHPNLIAAVVAIDGELIDSPGASRPSAPVPAVLVHGTADRVQPWAGRRARGITWPSYLSVLATVHAWVRADRAGPANRSVLTAPAGSGSGPVAVTSWAAGPTGAGVRLYAIVGMGHRWPTRSRPQAGPPRQQLEAVSATAIIVDTAATTSRRGRRSIVVPLPRDLAPVPASPAQGSPTPAPRPPRP